MPTKIKTKRRSPRGNWLVVRYVDGRIAWCRWVRTQAGVQMAKRNSELYIPPERNGVIRGRVIVLDVERMAAFAVSEGVDEINDLYRLFEKC